MSGHFKKWLGAFGAVAMVSLWSSALAQVPAGYTCGDGLEGHLYEYGNAAANPPPDRSVIYNTVALTDTVKDTPDNGWGSGAANPPFLKATMVDMYADQWVGGFNPPADGDYSFTIVGDDGVRVWVSDKPINFRNPGPPTPVFHGDFGASDPTTAVADSWVQQGDTFYTTDKIHLTKGKMEYIQFEHYEWQGGSTSRLHVNGNPIDKAQLCAPPATTQKTTIPGAISDLAASNPTSTGVDLTFTATGDNGAAGTAAFYDVRYSTAPITAANFAQAQSIPAQSTVPVPGAAGTKQTINVGGLDQIQQYYFAVRAGDAGFPKVNFGAISNVATVVTAPLKTGITAEFFGYDPSLGGSPDRTLVFDPMGQNGAKGLIYTTIYPYIDVVWSEAPAPGVPGDKFAVRFTGTITSPDTGSYNFFTASDDGIRLWISDKPINPDSDTPLSDGWKDRGNTEDPAAPFMMTKGTKYNILVEYYENGGGNEAHLRWQGPSTGGKVVIPTTAFGPDAAIPLPVNGRLVGIVNDANGKPEANAAVSIVQGKTTLTTTADANGQFQILLPGGATVVTASLPKPYDAINASSNLTVKEAALNTITLNLPGVLSYWRLWSSDLATAGAQGWDFLQTTPDDVASFAGGGDQNAPDAATLNKWCDPNLKTSGPSTLVPGRTWLANWMFVPNSQAGIADVGALGRLTPPDPSGIPDNSWWVQALHFKVPAALSKNTQWTLRDFNMDDYGEMFCINGKNIGGGPVNDWTINRNLAIPDGVIKTDGSDNLLVMVGFEGGGGAAQNEAYGGPALASIGPAGVSGVTLGDVNGDGKIDLKDATLSLQMAVGNLPNVTPTQQKADDVNKDGKYDLKDTTLILEAAVGLIKLM